MRVVGQPQFELPADVHLRNVTDLPVLWDLRFVWRAKDDSPALMQSMRRIVREFITPHRRGAAAASTGSGQAIPAATPRESLTRTSR